MGRVAGDRNQRAPCMNSAAARLEAAHRISFAQESGDLAVLDDVDAEPVCGARVTPGNRIMAHRAGSRLEQPAVDRKAAAPGVIEEWEEALHVGAIEELAVDAVESHDVALAGQD